MGRRQRQREREGERERPAGEPAAAERPAGEYTDGEGNVLVLRGVLSPATRREYAAVRGGSPLSAEDAWQRSVEFLFERLALRWVIAGTPIERQRELLARFRAATSAERAWVRTALREHCAEHFPELSAP